MPTPRVPLHYFLKPLPGNSLVVQWLGLRTFTAEGAGSIPGQGIKIPQAVWHGQKKKKKLVEFTREVILVWACLWEAFDYLFNLFIIGVH